MIPLKAKPLLRRIWYLYTKNPNRFLTFVSGVVHVGASSGQERKLYKHHGLRVAWVEPIPEIFAQLQENIKDFPDQQAFEALVTDVDGKEYEFNISSNKGQSSSILNLKEHKDIWPDVEYTTSIQIKSKTLPTLFAEHNVNPSQYQALIMDTQGSELLVLQGAVPILQNFEFIKTEVPDFESYEGCCQLKDIESFMQQQGYKELSRHAFATRDEGGSYYDIVYRKK